MPDRSGEPSPGFHPSTAASNVAYRLLGSATEAEDAVQDAYARWYGLPRSRQEEILFPGAWLTTVVGDPRCVRFGDLNRLRWTCAGRLA